MKKILISFILLMFTIACSTQQQGQKVELMVSSAASLTDALHELKPLFEEQHPHISLVINFGSSGKLAKQIEQGAPSDVFLSASKKDMDTLEAGDFIRKETRADFSKNKLVLITNLDKPMEASSFESIPVDQIQHMAIGEPDTVPAGRYAKEALERIGLWPALQGKLVLGSDVRQVLTYVSSGNADLGVVYASDAVTTPKIKILAEANSDWHQPIVYPGAVITASSHQEEAQAFMTFLLGKQGRETLVKYGFE
ncbi:molybdate ABC transporter substrate-binding protein [Ammoniphilus sp. YIM 78166]|uniref:molybdate ABC transporter substrate-binding protein n=1 Tax=Ammoniphilus sp. YIM 78166 TaxID=1644106 RepID=UPI0010705B42|nr:molybdate ABC transporter substrate-binding protein [Ammoniphilus sp. YIM 78166]